MAVVDHVLIVVLLATVLPVAMNASRVLRNVHSAKVFTTVLNRMKRMKSLMNTTELLVLMFCRFYLSLMKNKQKYSY